MDLTIYFEKIVRNFTRYHKYTLGSELRKKSREIVGLIIKANSAVEKLPGDSVQSENLFLTYLCRQKVDEWSHQLCDTRSPVCCLPRVFGLAFG